MITEDGIVCTEAELPHYIEMYGCKDEKDLHDLLFYDYGIDLVITDRPSTSQINN